MSQNDFSIANQGFPQFRSDLNSALQALASTSAGATAPGTTYAYQLWYDTSTNLLKMRNADNDGFITLAAFDQAADEWEVRTAVVQAVDSAGVVIKTDDGVARISVADSGTVTVANALIVNGAFTSLGIDDNASSTAMTLDSSGNVGFGTSNPGIARINSISPDATSGSFAFYGQQSGGTALLIVRGDGAFSTGTAALSPYNLTTSNAANVLVDSSGYLYRSTSSLKYKTNIQDATHGLADVMALRPVTYKSNRPDASGNVPDTVYGGLIAEEVHDAGLTEFVQYADDGTPDALSYGNMVALCIKAIQEQQAQIEELKAEVAALKGA